MVENAGYPCMRLAHISITARDADRLSTFYRCVLGCEVRRPPRVLSGPAVSRGNGLPGCEIYSIWLTLPGADTPFLELLQYKGDRGRDLPEVDAPGYGHLSFVTDSIEDTIRAVLENGGAMVGEVTNFGSAERPYLIVYVRDCEGNVLELEQAPT